MARPVVYLESPLPISWEAETLPSTLLLKSSTAAGLMITELADWLCLWLSCKGVRGQALLGVD